MISFLLVSSIVAYAQMKPMVPKFLNDFSNRGTCERRARVKSVTAAYETANGIYLQLKARMGNERFYRKHTLVIRPKKLPEVEPGRLSTVHELPAGSIMRGWSFF